MVQLGSRYADRRDSDISVEVIFDISDSFNGFESVGDNNGETNTSDNNVISETKSAPVSNVNDDNNIVNGEGFSLPSSGDGSDRSSADKVHPSPKVSSNSTADVNRNFVNITTIENCLISFFSFSVLVL